MTGLSDATTAASIPTPAMSPKYRSPARPRSIHETVPTSRSFTASGGSNGMPSSMASTLTVPVGTVNVLAMELGIPLDPPDAVKLLEVGTVSWIDLGLAGDRYFGLMAGVGMDAAVVASINPVLKKAFKLSLIHISEPTRL